MKARFICKDARLYLYPCYFMHQSIPAAPNATPPPPLHSGLLRGICCPCQSRGWGICKFCAVRGPGICQPRGLSWAFVTHAVSYQNITTPMILLTERKQIGSSVMGRKNWRGCKGMFLILCMHFLHCLLSQNYIAVHSEIGSYRRESTFFGYWIKFTIHKI